MKGCGVASSKSSKNEESTSIIPQATSIATLPSVVSSVEPQFEKFLDLPPEIQSSILSKGLPMTASRPSQQLELAAKITPRTVLSPNFLLPTKIITTFTSGLKNSEEKEFKTASEIKEYIAEVFKNSSTNKLYMISLQNAYTKITILNYAASKDGSININIFMPNISHSIATLVINFTRVKNQYDTIMLSKILLQLYLSKNSDLDYLKEIFIGLRWLPLVFKKMTWNRDLLLFEIPENIKVYLNGVVIPLKDIDQEVVQKALLTLRYVELSLKPKRKTTRSTKR